MAYATPADMAARYDENTIKELLSDDGDTSSIDLSTNPKLATLLDDGAGRINSCIMQSGHYSKEDLALLTDEDLAYLCRLNCELTMGYLMGRRPEKYADETVTRFTAQAREELDMIRRGHHLFNLQKAKDAGVPSVETPSVVDVNDLNLITSRSRGFYPSPGQRMPLRG